MAATVTISHSESALQRVEGEASTRSLSRSLPVIVSYRFTRRTDWSQVQPHLDPKKRIIRPHSFIIDPVSAMLEHSAASPTPTLQSPPPAAFPTCRHLCCFIVSLTCEGQSRVGVSGSPEYPFQCSRTIWACVSSQDTCFYDGLC